MIITLKINDQVIDMTAKNIRLGSIETFVTSGQPQMTFFMVTNRMPSPSPTFDPDNPWTYNYRKVEVILSSDDGTNSKTIFLGRVRAVDPSYRNNALNGFSFPAEGFGALAEITPVINPLDLSGSITFNPDKADVMNYDSILDGKSIGEAIQFLLGGYDIAQRLYNYGFTGMYTSLGSSSTAAVMVQKLQDEISQITARPLNPINFSGENLFGSIQSMLETYEPNFGLMADPHEKRFRFFNLNKTSKKTFTLGVDRIDGFTHKRDLTSSYGRVRIRGGANVRPYVAHFSYGPDTTYPKGYKTGNLIERFQYGNVTNDVAKSNWKLSDFERQVVVKGDSNGIYWPAAGEYKPCAQQTTPYPCKPTTMPSTNQVELNAASFLTNPETWLGNGTSIAWAKDEWAQTATGTNIARQGRLTIKRQFRWNGTETTTLKKGDIMWSIEDRFLIVGNDPYPLTLTKCDGGTCTYDKIRFTLDRPHGIDASTVFPPSDIQASPSDYKEEWNFELTGFNPSGAVVWRRYGVNFGTNTQKSTDRGVTRKIMKVFPEPVPWRSADGMSVTMVTTPQAAVIWSPDTQKPYYEWPINFYIDRENNEITFTPPVVRVFGTRSKLEAGGFNNSITPPWGVYSNTTQTVSQTIDGVPMDIRVMLPVADGTLTSVYPPLTANLTDTKADGTFVYGTAARYENLDTTLDVFMPSWVKLSNQATMDLYAAKVYDSVKDTVVHGEFDYIGLYDPWSNSWSPYWPTEETFVDEYSVTRTRPLVPSVKVQTDSSSACDTDGFGVLPEEELLIRSTAITFNEGANGKAAIVSMRYSNQRVSWVSPQAGFDQFSQSLNANLRGEMFDFQTYASPSR